jgi:hypothetical protein
VVALRGEDRFHRLEEVVLVHEAEVVGGARERLLLAVGAPHPAADDDVEPLERLAVGLHDDDAADVVDVQVDRVVAGDGERDLELLRQVGAAVERLDRVAGDDAVAIVVGAHLVELELANVALPVLDGRRLLAVEPEDAPSGCTQTRPRKARAGGRTGRWRWRGGGAASGAAAAARRARSR